MSMSEGRSRNDSPSVQRIDLYLVSPWEHRRVLGVAKGVTVVVQESGAALPIAIAGLVLSLASIAAAGILYWLNGSRVRLKLKLAMVGDTDVVEFDIDRTDQIPTLIQQGFRKLYLAVTVSNIGRGVTNVTKFCALLDNGARLTPLIREGSRNPSAERPTRLESHTEATYYVEMEDIATFAPAGDAPKPQYDVRMEVTFGNGRQRPTRESFTLTV